MEPSPHTQPQQAPKQHISPQDLFGKKEFVLRPQEDNEPPVMMGNSTTGENLPAFAFDAATVTKMVESSNDAQFLQEKPQPENKVTPEALQAEARLEKESTVIPPVPHVLRPDALKRAALMRKVQAAAAAGLVGIAGVMGADDANAGGIKGLEQFGKDMAAAQANVILNKIGVQGTLKRDQHGNPVLVAKSPQELAVNLAPRLEPGVIEYAQAIGLNVIDAGMIFQIQNNKNPAEQISFTKYHSPTHYTTGFSLRKSPGGGLLLSIQYIKDNLPKAELVTIRTDVNGKMGTVSVGN